MAKRKRDVPVLFYVNKDEMALPVSNLISKISIM